jgi:hypothetical protein
MLTGLITIPRALFPLPREANMGTRAQALIGVNPRGVGRDGDGRQCNDKLGGALGCRGCGQVTLRGHSCRRDAAVQFIRWRVCCWLPLYGPFRMPRGANMGHVAQGRQGKPPWPSRDMTRHACNHKLTRAWGAEGADGGPFVAYSCPPDESFITAMPRWHCCLRAEECHVQSVPCR